MSALRSIRLKPFVPWRMILGVITIAAASVVAGCGDTPDSRQARKSGLPMLALGDSIFAFHRKTGRSIPDVLARRLNRPVFNASVGGAYLSHPNIILRGTENDIRAQFAGGTWDWILFEGGANDLGAECRCEDCSAVLDGLIGPQARSGDIPRFLSQLRKTGARIMVMGYYPPGRAGNNFFKACTDDLEILNHRLAQFAGRHERVYFVSAGDVVSPQDPTHYQRDMVHPAPQTARRIGDYLARAIEEAEGR